MLLVWRVLHSLSVCLSVCDVSESVHFLVICAGMTGVMTMTLMMIQIREDNQVIISIIL